MIKIFIFLGVSILSLHAASFNCAKARTSIEKQICSDTNLSAMDEELAKTYKKLLSIASKNKISRYEGSSIYHFFKQKQKQWIKQRNKSCSKYKAQEQKACLRSFYSSRIAKLKEFADDGSMLYRNFGNTLFLYTHRPFISQNFKPYLDRASYKKLHNEILRWEESYSVCKDRFGVIDDSCAKKVAKEKTAYYDKLLASYKNNRYIQEQDKCIDIERKSLSFMNEDVCEIYNIYEQKELQKLFDKELKYTTVSYKLPKDPQACSSDTSHFYEQREQSITYISKNIVVLKTEEFSYTGGAHGDFATEYQNFDRHTAKEITWNDLFGDKEYVLFDFIVHNVKNKIGFSWLESQSDKELYAMAASTYRMQLTPEGVIIGFGLYEISGYGDGEPSFLIPLKLLKENMTQEKLRYYFTRPIKFDSVCRSKH